LRPIASIAHIGSVANRTSPAVSSASTTFAYAHVGDAGALSQSITRGVRRERSTNDADLLDARGLDDVHDIGVLGRVGEERHARTARGGRGTEALVGDLEPDVAVERDAQGFVGARRQRRDERLRHGHDARDRARRRGAINRVRRSLRRRTGRTCDDEQQRGRGDPPHW
jgi:hypothetical protein